MDIQALIEAARGGTFSPVHVLVGEETFLVERAVRVLKQAAVGDGISGFNEDTFQGAQLSAARVVAAARTLPMMGNSRFVLVRGADAIAAAELEGLADYLEAPSPSTCLVIAAEKLDGRTRFAKIAKKVGAWVDAPPAKPRDARAFALTEAKRRGHSLDADAADELIDAVGSELAAVDDAIERLSLYVGPGAPIGVGAITRCVAYARVDSIWALVDAVSARHRERALHAAGTLLADREPPLRILAMVARQLRMVARMQSALARGLRGADATKEAGAPPFKAQELTDAARRFSRRELGAVFRALADADLAMKGSKRSPETVLEQTLLRLTATKNADDARAPRRA